MYKITIENDSKILSTQESKYGRFNEFPPNWSPITEKELIQNPIFAYYIPHHIEYRQMWFSNKNGKLEKDSKLVSARLFFFFDGSGYAVECNSTEGKFNYYKFCYCVHEFVPQETHGSRCIHTSVCKKCGYVREYDTSD